MNSCTTDDSMFKESIVVVAVGTFDVLHLGHLRYLEYARRQGTVLKVILPGDDRTIKRKGFLFHDLQTRKSLLEGLSVIDEVWTSPSDDLFMIMKNKQVDVLVVGYDELFSNETLHHKLVEYGLVNVKVVQCPFFFGKFFKKKVYTKEYLEFQEIIQNSPEAQERTITNG